MRFRFYNGATPLLTPAEENYFRGWEPPEHKLPRNAELDQAPGARAAAVVGDLQVRVAALELSGVVAAVGATDAAVRQFLAKLVGPAFLGDATRLEAYDDAGVLGYRALAGGGASVLDAGERRWGTGEPRQWRVTLTLACKFPLWTATAAETQAAYDAAAKVVV